MHPFLDYFIKANGLLLFFWLFYRLFLHKETFYTTNRWYMLGSIALSIIAPFITFTKTVFIEAPKPTIDWDQLAAINSQNTIVEENLFTIENLAIVIIGLISTILILKTLFQLARTYHKIKQLPYDATLQVRRSNNDTIFSLYPYIVVPNNFEEFPNSEMILTHEKVHIQQKHSFDMILMQLIRSVFWMNPLLSYFQKDVEVNLEYIVDEHLQTQFDSKMYQLSLLSFHTATPQPFVNSFNSQLKKRILQINTKKSNPMKKLKMILAAPAIVAFFTLFQIETIAQVKNDNTKPINEKNNFNQNDLILKTLQNDVKSIQEDKNVYKEIIKQYKTTIDGKDVSIKDLEIFDNSKIKSVAVDFSNAQKGTQVDLITTGQEDVRSFKFGILSSDESKKYLGDRPIDSNDSNKLPNKSLDKILIDGKESSMEEWQLFFKQNTPFTSQIENRVLIVKSIKKDNLKDEDNNNEITKQTQYKKPLYILNGKEISETDFRTIQPDDIESVTVLKDKNATEKYGAKGIDGVIEIQLKEKKS